MTKDIKFFWQAQNSYNFDGENEKFFIKFKYSVLKFFIHILTPISPINITFIWVPI